jgi:hypothetical protein
MSPPHSLIALAEASPTPTGLLRPRRRNIGRSRRSSLARTPRPSCPQGS